MKEEVKQQNSKYDIVDAGSRTIINGRLNHGRPDVSKHLWLLLHPSDAIKKQLDAYLFYYTQCFRDAYRVAVDNKVTGQPQLYQLCARQLKEIHPWLNAYDVRDICTDAAFCCVADRRLGKVQDPATSDYPIRLKVGNKLQRAMRPLQTHQLQLFLSGKVEHNCSGQHVFIRGNRTIPKKFAPLHHWYIPFTLVDQNIFPDNPPEIPVQQLNSCQWIGYLMKINGIWILDCLHSTIQNTRFAKEEKYIRERDPSKVTYAEKLDYLLPVQL